MQPTNNPVSKSKVVFTWVAVVGNIILWTGLAVWWLRSRTRGPIEPTPDPARGILLLAVGGFLLVAGVICYLIVIYTHCLTFRWDQPVWHGLKGRMFLINVTVTFCLACGIGFIFGAFIGPVLAKAGVGGSMAYFFPGLALVAIIQIIQLWVFIWTPLAPGVITRRLQAQGINAAQLQSAILIGTSDPTRSSFKKLSSVLDDIGALWLSPDQLVYWGDGERFAINREQLSRIERRSDSGGTSMLGGIQHVILHVRLADGAERQIRLHTTGSWTMGRSRRAMDRLAELISTWHARTAPASAA